MITIENVYKKFGKNEILKNLSCQIESHSIYGLVGANGAGKSTLLRLINGVYEMDKGSIQIDGVEISDKEELKQKLVFVPDDLFFYSTYTLLDSAKFYKAMYKKFDMEAFQEMATLLKLDLHTKISTFSKGMKRQCALILALATNAEYMFFDETFDGVDPVVRTVLRKLLAKQTLEKEATIIMTSHNLRELEDICDNLGLLYQGGILFQSDIDTLKTNMCKVQISLKGEFSEENFKDFSVLNYKKCGSVATLIIRGTREETEKKFKDMKPIILDYIPITLEELFIYEMESVGYVFNEII